MDSTVTQEQAFNQTKHAMLWRAYMRTGEVIWEQPGLSSDRLPADDVVRLDYVPVARSDLPTIEAHIDLAKGERFVRYWTNIWCPNGRGIAMLYVLGIVWQKKHAMLCYYPHFNKIILAATRPFQPTWTPKPFAHLPPNALTIGGPGSSRIGWQHEGFGGMVDVLPNKRITLRGYHA